MKQPALIPIVIPSYEPDERLIALLHDLDDKAMGPVIIVNDGSSEKYDDIFKEAESIITKRGGKFIAYRPNRGKGRALKTGLEAARKLGYRFALTLDADGQHDPADIPALVAAAGERTLVVGSRNLTADGMPAGNTFANKFSNFWFTVQTGRKLPDTQTGFRVYPLEDLPSLKLLTARYEAELTLLVFSAWKNLRIVPVPVRVYYPEDRVSHFRPFADFFRISVLNTVLCVLALVYGYPRMLLGR